MLLSDASCPRSLVHPILAFDLAFSVLDESESVCPATDPVVNFKMVS